MLNIFFISKDDKIFKSNTSSMPYLPTVGDSITFDNIIYKVTQRVFLPEERVVQVFIEWK